ncbi:MAG: CDP-diacylglycerol--serine O-phosphatidyltransferase [Holosporaceae bacterium]|jgi:CDP-diacylglycerol--serine O-phosphatidyltransferase|nr:CDP-diacylglycerol--serine O-phosphatidyltransferase [Holosporaceae bacterium]
MKENIQNVEFDGEEETCVAKKSSGFIRFLPGMITISAFCVGLTSIRFALFHKWELAVLCIFASAMLDALDGKVARLFGQSSQFGAQLDSLSDLVCFGVAPAIILFLQSVYLLENVGWGICMFFTVCCALRLARFNSELLSNDEKPGWEKKYFKGVPAPAGAILALFPMILFFQTNNYAFLAPKFIAFCLWGAGALMISSVRTFSSKMIEVNSGSMQVALLITSLFVICLITDVWLTLLTLVTAYLFSIPYGACVYAKTKKAELNTLLLEAPQEENK